MIMMMIIVMVTGVSIAAENLGQVRRRQVLHGGAGREDRHPAAALPHLRGAQRHRLRLRLGASHLRGHQVSAQT